MKKILSYLLVISTVLFCLVSCDGNVSKKGGITPFNPVADDSLWVTFDSKGGTVIAPKKVSAGGTVTAPADNPTKQNHGFMGWTTDSNANITSADFDFNTPITSNITLYAKWAFGRGIAATIDANRPTCTWVQLWEDGPKFAEFNIGSTISSYASANTDVSSVSSLTSPTDDDKNVINTLYSTANVGGLYGIGGYTSDSRITGEADNNTGYSQDYILLPEYDTAKNLWGSNWKMPTKDQLTSLTDSNVTTWTWCTGTDINTRYISGCTLSGYKVSGKGAYANNSIFLPAAGCGSCESGTLSDMGICGNCFSTTFSSGEVGIYILGFNSSVQDVNCVDTSNTCSVLAVLVE